MMSFKLKVKVDCCTFAAASFPNKIDALCMVNLPNSEQQRLAALHSYQILDTDIEQDYDELTALAAAICGAPIALISLVDSKRQWFKSHKGLDVNETERSMSFCAHAIRNPDELMQVENAQMDERFKDNPLVTGDPRIAFYAGMPLIDDAGHALGTLCVIDNQPRQLNETQQQALTTLSKQVVNKLTLRKKLIDLEAANRSNFMLHEKSRENERNLRHIIEQSPAAIVVFRGPELTIDAINPAMLKLLAQPADIQGKPLLDAIPELKGQPAYNLLHEIYQTGQAIRRREVAVELERNGKLETGYFDFTYTPLMENGVVAGIIDMAVEVTEQVQARAAIEQSAHQLQQMVMNAPMGMCIIRGHDLVIEIANEPMLKIWTRTAYQVLGKRLTDVFPEVKDQPYPAMLRNVLSTGEPLAVPELTADIAETDGTINQIYIDFTYKPLRNAEGRPEAIMATVIDITETVKARKALEQSERQLQGANAELGTANEEYIALNEELQAINEQLTQTDQVLQDLNERMNIAIDAGSLGVTEVDLATGQMNCNDTFKKFFGRVPEQTLTYPEIFDMMLPAYREEVREKASRARAEHSLYHAVYEIQWEDGSLHWISAYGRGRYNQEGIADRMVGMISDITEQKQAQQAIEQLNAQLKEKEESLRLSVEAARMGTYNLDLKTGIVEVNAYCRRIFGFPDEMIVTTQEGFGAMEKDESRIRKAINDSILQATVFDEEYRIVRMTDQSVRWVRSVGRVSESQTGAAPHFYGTIMDITDRKADDQRKKDFIGIVSHEMRTPLTSLSGYVQILLARSQKANDRFASEIAEKAKRQVERMTTLITDFLDVARAGEGKIHLQLTKFDMAVVIGMAEAEVRSTITTHSVIFHPTEPLIITGDQNKLEQVLINIINNAVKYSPGGSTIQVRCTARNGGIHVSVTDEGMGIPLKDQPHIFDRFYRVLGAHTKFVTGFGIGLYLCKEIIDQHGGKIGVESVPGQGSTFWFELLPSILKS